MRDGARCERVRYIYARGREYYKLKYRGARTFIRRHMCDIRHYFLLALYTRLLFCIDLDLEIYAVYETTRERKDEKSGSCECDTLD